MASEASEPAFFRQLPCWRWYGVSMVGVAELGIREYVWRKEPEEKKHEQLELNLPQAPSRGLHQTAPEGAVADCFGPEVATRLDSPHA